MESSARQPLLSILWKVAKLSRDVQQETGKSIELAYVDQGYTGDTAAKAADKQKIELVVVKLPGAKRGFVLLPRRWQIKTLAFFGRHWIKQVQADFRLLTIKEMRALFPDAEIVLERYCGFVKSIVAIKT